MKPDVSAERVRAELEPAFQQSAQEGWNVAPALGQQGQQSQEPRDMPGSELLTAARG